MRSVRRLRPGKRPRPIGRALKVDNYFNYFTEIEEYFVSKRGKHLLVSPLDWCLIELWKNSGIPLNVVLRGIDHSFETNQKTARKPPSSLFYCHPAILEAFEQHQNARLGVGEAQPSQASSQIANSLDPAAILQKLGEFQAALERLQDDASARAVKRLKSLAQDLERAEAVDYRSVDQELAAVGQTLAEAWKKRLDPDRRKEIRREIRGQTRIYKRRLDKDSFRRLEESLLQRILLKERSVPPLTLFSFDD